MKTEIYWIEGTSAGRLAVMPRPRGGDWLRDEMQSLRDQGVVLLISLLTSDEENELQLSMEESIANEVGIDYLTFPLEDRTVPGLVPETRDFFKVVFSRFCSGDWIAVHCRMGIGRSALVAATVLSMAGLTPETAFKQISIARGFDVPDTEDQREWVTKYFETTEEDIA